MDDIQPDLVERLDPRSKLVALIVLAAELFLINSLWALLLPAIFVIAGIAASSITVASFLKSLRKVVWFVAIIVVINTFTVSGYTFINLWGSYGTYEGLLTGLSLSARIVLVFSLSSVFARTTPIHEIIDGLEAGLRPIRFIAGPLIMMMTVAINFVPVLIQTAQRIRMAQVARGADTDSSFLKQVRFALAAVVPLFAGVHRSADHLATAMEARGYVPTLPRSRFHTLKFKPRDSFLFLLVLASIVVLLIIPA